MIYRTDTREQNHGFPQVPCIGQYETVQTGTRQEEGNLAASTHPPHLHCALPAHIGTGGLEM